MLAPTWAHVGSKKPSWRVLGRLGRSWAALGGSWGRLGGVLGASWGVLDSDQWLQVVLIAKSSAKGREGRIPRERRTNPAGIYESTPLVVAPPPKIARFSNKTWGGPTGGPRGSRILGPPN